MIGAMDRSTKLVILCNNDGLIIKLFNDDFNIAQKKVLVGCPIISIFDHASAAKATKFIKEIQDKGSSCDWELNLDLGGEVKTLVFQGYQMEKEILIMGVETVNVSVEIYNKLTALTTELVSMQRDLVKKNNLLQKLNEEKNEFLGMAAHDLRSPLSAILAYAQLLKEEVQKVKNRDMLSIIQSAVEYMLGLINNLLDISAIEAGKLNLHIEPVNIGELISKNLNTNQIVAQKKSITILNHIHCTPTLLVDQLKLEQVLYNLISNAIKFSAPGGKIDVNAAVKGENIIISISDQGKGISPAEIEKLFKPFVKGNSQGTAGEYSTGLGLVISKKIVEEHGGRIWLDSEINKGSTFYFSLPLSNIHNCPNQSPPLYIHKQEAAGQSSSDLSVAKGTIALVVDDDPIILDYISMGLNQRGFKVSTANNGKDALKLAEYLCPDIVILDWVLPDAQGPDICRNIKKLSDPIIIILSGKTDLVNKINGLQAGADDYQTKPFHLEELLARIESLLRRRGGSQVKQVLTFSDIYLWPDRREVQKAQRRLSLTPTEFDLLYLLMKHPYQVLPKENILESVWGSSFMGDVNVVEVYIGYLRRKLGKPSPIKTVRGVGYVMDDKNDRE